MYIERLSKKSKNGDFGNFACNEISSIQAPNLQIQSFSTVSENIQGQGKGVIYKESEQNSVRLRRRILP